MNIFKLLFQLFLLYMLYKLVFEFIIPVYRASKRMKQEVNQMQQKMQEHQRQQQQTTRQETFVNSHSKSPQPGNNRDYIEFEELK
jgi:hypothetical protein